MNVLSYLTPAIVFPLVLLVCIFCFFGWYWLMLRRRTNTDALLQLAGETPDLPPAPMTFAGRCTPLDRRDRVLMLLLTLVYAATAFFRLGSTTNPQSFQAFSDGETVEVSFSQPIYAASLFYYTGLGTGNYNIEISQDGEYWSTLWTHRDADGGILDYYWAAAEGYAPSYALPQSYDLIFKWETVELTNPRSFQYLRITGDTTSDPFELGELAFLDQNGERVDLTGLVSGGTGSALFDEQDVVPTASSWYNSTYFDEIYHARTAYEHLRGVYPYEVSHPPLGKLILSVGIALFGMTPFGWRFMGTLFGVLMLPILYLFLKNFFGKTPVAFCGTCLFAFDFMHLTQTRIATIDTYAVFFILLMYYFMYRYLTLPAGTPFRKGARWLFLSGLFWGIGAASKWTVLYGGAGLAALYFIGLYFKLRDWPRAEAAAERPVRLRPWLIQTLAFSVLCFVLLPAVIYTASYLPYAAAKGVDLSLGNTLSGFGENLPVLLHNLWGHFTGGADFEPEAISQDSLSGIMLQNQWYMLTYHEGVHATHPYESRWYQWIVDARPILYYMEDGAGYHTRFAAFSNPVVCWGGLLAMMTCAAQAFRRFLSRMVFFAVTGLGLCVSLMEVVGITDPAQTPLAKLGSGLLLLALLLAYMGVGYWVSTASPRRSSKALFVLAAYFSQLAPWFFISRTTFAYHYFPSILFLCFALAYVLNDILELGPPRSRRLAYAVPGVGAGLYAAFYPVLIGLSIPVGYAACLRWFFSWPF